MFIFAFGERDPGSRSLVSAFDLKGLYLKQDRSGLCHACGADRSGIPVLPAGLMLEGHCGGEVMASEDCFNF